jgi:hypothetical protein
LIEQKWLVAVKCQVKVVVNMVTGVAQTHSDLLSFVDTSSCLFAAGVAENFAAQPAVVSSVYYSEYFVAVVAVSGLAVRHPLSLAGWSNDLCYLIFELANLLYKRLTF